MDIAADMCVYTNKNYVLGLGLGLGLANLNPNPNPSQVGLLARRERGEAVAPQHRETRRLEELGPVPGRPAKWGRGPRAAAARPSALPPPRAAHALTFALTLVVAHLAHLAACVAEVEEQPLSWLGLGLVLGLVLVLGLGLVLVLGLG